MKLQDVIIDSIVRSAVQVFSTMLEAEILPGPISFERTPPGANDGVVSFIGLAGSWAGAGSISCSPAMACRVCDRMLMTESGSVNDEVLDAVAELTNMIIGGVKTDLEEQLGPLGLSIPTVVYGRNFKAKGAGNAEWIVAPFSWDGEQLVVKLCLAPSERTHLHHHHALGQTCPLEI
jgi:chemotaxis protein CheX